MNLLEIPEIPALWFWLSLFFNVLLILVNYRLGKNADWWIDSSNYWRDTKEEAKRQRDYWHRRTMEEFRAKKALTRQVKKWAGRARDAGWAEKTIQLAREDEALYQRETNN